MILKSGEQKRREEKAIVKQFSWVERDERSLQGEEILFLTTQRLILERSSKGKAITLFEFPFGAIDQVRIEGLISKFLLLRVVLNRISSKVEGIDFSNKEGVAYIKIKVDGPKGLAKEIRIRSGKK
ncbi:MAG: hypothetical protein GH144_05625 [Clostridia bacterium]|jgi:hypothetical protein|nr:hypothetical protein [Clostridia bacterium]